MIFYFLKVLNYFVRLLVLALLIDGQSYGQGKADQPASQKKAETRDEFVLQIEAAKDLQAETIGARSLSFQDVCHSFGANFVKNQGILGTGGFSAVKCLPSGVRQTGRANPWQMRISRTEAKSIFEIFYYDRGAEKNILQIKYEIESTLGTLRILDETRYSRLIAAYLNVRLPFMASVPSDKITASARIELLGSSLEEVKIDDRELLFFSLKRADEKWAVQPRGTGELSIDGDNVTLLLKTLKSQPRAQEQIPSNTLVHFRKGRVEIATKLDQLLKQRMTTDLQSFISSVRAGYAGVRYAMPFGGGEGAFAAAASFGLLAEFRGG
jgi:hypothetical protein